MHRAHSRRVLVVDFESHVGAPERTRGIGVNAKTLRESRGKAASKYQVSIRMEADTHRRLRTLAAAWQLPLGDTIAKLLSKISIAKEVKQALGDK